MYKIKAVFVNREAVIHLAERTTHDRYEIGRLTAELVDAYDGFQLVAITILPN